MKSCKGTGPLRSQKNALANLQDASRRTCGHCGNVLGSRSELFRHLKACKNARNGTIHRPAEAQATAPSTQDNVELTHSEPLPVSAYQVREAPMPGKPATADSPLGNYTYLRVAARPRPDGSDSDICLEPTSAEQLSFESIQAAICKEHPTILHHFNPDKALFL